MRQQPQKLQQHMQQLLLVVLGIIKATLAWVRQDSAGMERPKANALRKPKLKA